MASFILDRSLLNPKFEGYRLSLISQDDSVSRYPLAHPASQIAASGKSPLSFQEVSSRITHNHLVVAPGHSNALYVDAQLNVILIQVDQDTLLPSFRVVYELPKPLQSPNVQLLHREYPSAAFLDYNTVFVSDGRGSLHIVDTTTPQLIAQHELLTEGKEESLPFRIHSVSTVHPDSTVVAILSSRHYPDAPTIDSAKHVKPPVEFDIWAVEFSLPFQVSSGPMKVLWQRRGADVPLMARYIESKDAYLLTSTSLYRTIDAPPLQIQEPLPEEMAPIPRKDENFDANSPEPPKPLPYSWTQTSDSVTVAFPLPSSTPTSNIKVTFSPCTLTVHIQAPEHTFVPIPFPRYSAESLWDKISVADSVWTWDKEGEHTYGLLTVHLEKHHEGTRWVQVFKDDEKNVEVPETLDPSELVLIRESLEKYTTSLRDGSDISGLGLGRGVPSLAEGEMDDEVDASIGKTVFLSWVAANGSLPTWASQEPPPVQLLGTALPGGDIPQTSFIVKNNLDGNVFNLQQDSDRTDVWKHTLSYPALAFVLASKQDTRFTFHSSNAVFAFENGVRDRGGNVYIYRAAPVKEKWAKQAVLKVGDGEAGALLGVASFQTAEKKLVVICLTESELIIIHGAT